MLNYFKRRFFRRQTSSLHSSVKSVATAIPAFIGYTEQAPTEPTPIESMYDYRALYGGPADELPNFIIDDTGAIFTETDILSSPVYKMYYQLEWYFSNGGGHCYIISAGNYNDDSPGVHLDDYLDGLKLLEQHQEPTLIVFPDAQNLSDITQYHVLYKTSLMHCSRVDNRFVICDVKPAASGNTDPVGAAATAFRNRMGINNLMHGAAYYPSLETNLKYEYREDKIAINNNGTPMVLRHSDATLAGDIVKKEESLFHVNNGAGLLKYRDIKKMIGAVDLVLPPSSAIAGVYAAVDAARGVWKAPANISINMVKNTTVSLDNNDQQLLNISSTGKSINAIREFPGKGVLVWGARTLAGNDNEWRYISVRRFCSMVETSVKKATKPFVFEPNDANTWLKVKTMVGNFLSQQWRQGALSGATQDESYFVKVGLGETMTQNDIQSDKLIIEMGVAVVRPAEFTILQISHDME